MAIGWQRTAAGQPAWNQQESYRTSFTGTDGAGGTLSRTSAASAYRQGLAGTTTMFSSVTASYSSISSGLTISGNGNTVSNSGATDNGGGIGTTTISSSHISAITTTHTSPPLSGSGSTSGSHSREITRNIVGSRWSQTIRDTTDNLGIPTTYSITASGIASAAYTSGTSSSEIVDYRGQSTTQTTTRSIITKHSDSSLSSTTTESQTYTETTLTYETVDTTTRIYVTASYITGINHTQQVWEAEYSEFLRAITASPTTFTGLDALLGGAARSLTQSAGAGSYSYEAAVGQALNTFTCSMVFSSEVPTTLTTTFRRSFLVTRGDLDGWVGGTNTNLNRVDGIYTSAQAMTIPLTTSANTYTARGRATYTTLSSVSISYILTDTVTGINSAGSSASYVIQRVGSTVSKYTSTILVTDSAESSSLVGFSVTKFISPVLYYGSDRASVELSRLEKALGYQHASSLGSGGGRGVSLSANSSFFIGTGNYIMCDPNGVRTPVPSVSTASTADSSYSFTQGAAGQWSVTALRTDTSSSTLTTFTASVGTAGAADVFMNQYASWYNSSNGSVIGGANALSGVDQIATFHNVAGWKYTLKDATGTTAYTTHLAGYTTANIGTSMFAGDSFSAASDISVNEESPISFMVLPFNQ